MTKIYLFSVFLVVVAIGLVGFALMGPSEAPLSRVQPALEDREGTSVPTATVPGSDISSGESSASPPPVVPPSGASAGAGVSGFLVEQAQVDPAALEQEQDAKEEAIWEAAHTFSIEGLRTIAPMLQDPDPEIRVSAIEAIEQLSLPEGIAVLRRAAAQARNADEQRRMLEAAEWLTLPERENDGIKLGEN